MEQSLSLSPALLWGPHPEVLACLCRPRAWESRAVLGTEPRPPACKAPVCQALPSPLLSFYLLILGGLVTTVDCAQGSLQQDAEDHAQCWGRNQAQVQATQVPFTLCYVCALRKLLLILVLVLQR